jgi:hypothetical protein
MAPIVAPLAEIVERPAKFDDDLELGERLLLAETVITPVAAARGGDDAGAACRAAGVLGMQLRSVLDGGGVAHLAVLPHSRQAAAVIVRTDGRSLERPRIVTAPRASTEPYTARAALALFNTLEARALVLAAPSRTLRGSTYDAVLAALADRPELIEVRGGVLPDGAVLAWGGVTGAPSARPKWLVPLEEALAGLGIATRPYDGSLDDSCCNDLGSVRRASLAHLGEARVVSVYLSVSAREQRFGGAGLGSSTGLATEMGLPRRDEPISAALGQPPRCVEGAGAEETFALARRWAELRHVGDLKKLAARPGVSLVADPVTGERFVLTAGPCTGRSSAGVVSLRHPGGDPTTLRWGDPAAMRRLSDGGVTAAWMSEETETR